MLEGASQPVVGLGFDRDPMGVQPVGLALMAAALPLSEAFESVLASGTRTPDLRGTASTAEFTRASPAQPSPA